MKTKDQKIQIHTIDSKDIDKFFRGTSIILCLGIDVGKSKQEKLDIYDTM